MPFRERVDTVLEWLSLPADQRPDLVTLYFDEPDHTGHAEGPGPGQQVSYFRTSVTTSCLRNYWCPPKSRGGEGDLHNATLSLPE